MDTLDVRVFPCQLLNSYQNIHTEAFPVILAA